MILQSFIKGGTERIAYGYYEYPGGADIIFDFGNPTCTSEFVSNNRVYNVGSANITGSLIPYNNPGPIYPTLNTGAGASGGNMAVRYVTGITGGNHLEWSWPSTENQTSVVIYAPNGSAVSGEDDYSPRNTGADSIQFETQRTIVYTRIDGNIIFTSNIDTSVGNGRNSWNQVAVTADGSTGHFYYQNLVQSGESNTTNIPRTTTANQTNQLGWEANLKYIAFLQYPRILNPVEIRQIYRVFSQRFFL